MDADLILEGGGVKGIALVGSYTALSEAGYDFHRIAGTSAGAIVGALIAAGMSPGDLKGVMREIDYGRFEDKGFIDHLGLVGKGASLLFEKGIYEGSYLRAFMDEQLKALGVETFGDLRIDDPGASPGDAKAYRLVVMTSDVTRARLVRLPWDYEQYGLDPDTQRVADAVRASMSIPFFYEPVRFTSRDAEGKEATSYMVDGGMLSNFPVWLFDVDSPGRPLLRPTFGFTLTGGKGVGGGLNAAVSRMPWAVRFGADIFHTSQEAWDARFVSHSTRVRTVTVDAGNVGTTDFNLPVSAQDMLIANGRDAAKRFLDRFDLADYENTYHRTFAGAGDAAPAAVVSEPQLAGRTT